MDKKELQAYACSGLETISGSGGFKAWKGERKWNRI